MFDILETISFPRYNRFVIFSIPADVNTGRAAILSGNICSPQEGEYFLAIPR
jgi:hypothetical protein